MSTILKYFINYVSFYQEHPYNVFYSGNFGDSIRGTVIKHFDAVDICLVKCLAVTPFSLGLGLRATLKFYLQRSMGWNIWRKSIFSIRLYFFNFL